VTSVDVDKCVVAPYFLAVHAMLTFAAVAMRQAQAGLIITSSVWG
jgi:hypothetical protein